MIILIGQTHDDVLYFENILREKRNQTPLFNQFPMIKGFIFNQEVLLVYNAISSYVVGLITTVLVEKYQPLCVILFGRCKSVSPSFKAGDIAISRQIVPLDIDQTEYFNVKVGEIPFVNNDFHIDHSCLDLIIKSFASTETNNYQVCSFLSANKVFSSTKELEQYGDGSSFLGKSDLFVLDSDCISPFLICRYFGVPFVSVKVVDSKIGEETSVESFVKTLATYAQVGKSISSFIGEIGRRDLVQE